MKQGFLLDGAKQGKEAEKKVFPCHVQLLPLVYVHLNLFGFSSPLWIAKYRKHVIYIQVSLQAVIYLFLDLVYATLHTPTLFFLPAE